MKASSCFFQAAKQLLTEGATRDANLFFSKAYNMFQVLRQEAGDTNSHNIVVDSTTGVCTIKQIRSKFQYTEDVYSDLSESDVQDEIAETISTASNFTHSTPGEDDDSASRLTNDIKIDYKKRLDNAGEVNALEKAFRATYHATSGQFSLKRRPNFDFQASKALYDVFKGDLLSLEATIMMLIRFSQCLLLTQDDQSVISVILKEALQLIMLSRRSSFKKASIKFNQIF
jgi:hypothetical protein